MSEYWKTRSQNIKDNVTMRDLIDHFNVVSKSEGMIAQVNCPFHGADRHASARIYETNTMYCWVCSSVWDVISFTKDMLNISYSEACNYLERNYSIKETDKSIAYQPQKPSFLTNKKMEVTPFDFESIFNKIQEFLIRNKDSFDFDKYLKYFYYYDSLHFKYKKLEASPNLIDLEIPLKELYKEVLRCV